MKKHLFLAAASLAAITLSAPAFAQSPAKPAEAATADSGDTIVVTAQRREENIQNVNIAITAINGEALAEKAVVRQLDLQNVTPGLSIVKAGLTESVNIRGIGLASGSPNVSNGVANYLDGIFQPPIVSTGSFYDIQNVEILRGPQGTLVGSSSTGGALLINTNRPKLGQFSGYLEGQVGSFGLFAGNGAVNVPLGENFAIRGASLYSKRNSYYKNTGLGVNRPDRLTEKDLRLSALFKSGGFSAYVKGESVVRDTGGYAWQPITGTAFAAGRTNIPWAVNYNAQTQNYERANIFTGELKYETEGGLVIRSLTGHMNKRINNLYDSDATAIASNTQNQYVRERQFSEEIDVISDASKAFNFILGGYFQRNKIDVKIGNFGAGGSITGRAQIDTKNDKKVYGLFGQANYQLSDQFEIQVGARYNKFKINTSGNVIIGNTPVVIPQIAAETDNKMSGKVALNYKPNDDNLIYAFVARGYKPGGANPGVAAPNPPTFKPETVTDYELGWKGSFMDKHVTTQIGFFYNNYRNFQQTALNTATGTNNILFNIASAKIKGLEIQVQAHVGGLRLDAGLAYTDSKLSPISIVNTRILPAAASNKPQCTAGAVPPACFDYAPFVQTTAGGTALYAPKVTWNGAIGYDIEAGSTVITPRIQYSHVGGQWGNLLYNAVTDRINGHNLLSATLTVKFDKFKIEGYGTNLSNKFYVAGQSGNQEFYGAPREYGIRVKVNY